MQKLDRKRNLIEKRFFYILKVIGMKKSLSINFGYKNID